MKKYIINIAKGANYKIEIIEDVGDAILKFNKYHYKSLKKGHNIKRILETYISFQSFNLPDDLEYLLKDLTETFAEMNKKEVESFKYLINWTDF